MLFIHAPGLAVTLTSDCPETLARMRNDLLPWLPQVGSRLPGDRQLLLSVRRAAAPHHFHVDRNEMPSGSAVAASRLLAFLQQAIEEAFVQVPREFAAVHAGVVVHGGVAIILPGRSHAGKTTLVRELIMRGAEYSSDELALIDAAGQVHPWPRPLMVRDSNSEQQPCRAADLGAKVRSGPARAGLIVFLRYSRSAEFEVNDVDQSAARFGLLSNTPHVVADHPHILGPLTAAASSAKAFEGVRGDAGPAADALLRMAADLS